MTLGATGAPRRERNASETRRRLLDAAEAEFAAKGFDGARLGTIARAASVQQALIHHYFSDKAGLYAEVVERSLGGMSAQGMEILERFIHPLDASRIRPLTEAFVDMFVEFYLAHGAILSILRLEGDTEGNIAAPIIAARAKPVFDAVVAAIEELRARGDVRHDLDARHMCVSVLAMASITVLEERFIRGIWPIDPRSPAFIAERKREIVATVLASLAP